MKKILFALTLLGTLSAFASHNCDDVFQTERGKFMCSLMNPSSELIQSCTAAFESERGRFMCIGTNSSVEKVNTCSDKFDNEKDTYICIASEIEL